MARQLFFEYARATQLTKLKALAGEVLDSYGLTEFETRLLRYEDNAVYEVKAGARRYMLRMSVHDGRTVTEQQAELCWLHALANWAVHVPRPVAARDGKSGGSQVLELHTDFLEEQVTAVLFEWIDGKVAPPCMRVGVAEKFGAVTARIHNVAERLRLPDGLTRPSWNVEDVFDKGAVFVESLVRDRLSNQNMTLLQEVATRVHEELDPHVANRQQYLIHADLHRENAILMSSGQVALIDFDDCGFGDPGLDIATVLSSVYRQTRGARPCAYENFALPYLIAYKAERALPKSLGNLSALLVMRDMIILNFVLSSHNPTVETWGPARVRGILDEMKTYVATGRYVGDNVA